MKNKLVLKNLVYRFKEGRKIIKAEDGWRLLNGRAVLRNVNNAYAARQAGDKKLTHRYVLKGKLYGSFDGGKTYYSLTTGNKLNEKSNSNLLYYINRRYKPPKSEDNQNLDKRNNQNSGKRNNLTIDNYYLSEFAKRKSEIDKLGGVRAVQKKLGFTGSALDGKWGPNTEREYLKQFVGKNIMSELSNPNTVSEEQNTIPTIKLTDPSQVIQTTPYRTDFDYTGSNKVIRDFGFNNYAGLLNFVRSNSNNQFAKDLIKRFGNVDNWNQANVENALHVNGTYRRGINGDFSDIMRSMATWAGAQNGIADRQLNLTPIRNYDSLNLSYLDKNGRFNFLKKGGQLVSKNPIKRFKSGGVLKFLKAGNLPTAPKAEDRYKNGHKYGYRADGSVYLFPSPLYTIADIKGVRTDYPFMSNLGEIKRTIFYTGDNPMDTMYTEIPNSVFPVERKYRYANSKNKTPEYEILKRRFNTAWNLAK